MNISVYIFGSLGNGYSQYPNDYSQTIFQNFYAQSTAPTQIVVHREDKLIYYGYIRKLDAGQHIGLCVVLNSLMLTDFKEMFSLFENTITSMVVNGSIIHFNEKSNIVSKVDRLYTNQIEVSRITDFLRNEFTKLERTSRPLPPISYGIARNEKRTFSIDDNVNDIIKASTSYNYTFVYKRNDFDTQSLNSYKEVLNRINNENIELRKINQDLRDENAKILREKKQFKNVILLILAIIGCGISIYFLNDNLNHTQNQLTEANKDIATKTELLEEANRNIIRKDSTISLRNETISSLNNTIVNLNDTVNKYKTRFEEETSRRMDAEKKYNSYKSTLSGYQPFIVKGTSFDFSSGKYKVNYYGLTYGKYNINFRVILPDNSTKIFEHSLRVYTGSNNVTVSLSNSFDSGKDYTIEIMYNNRVIGGSRHKG